MNHKQFAVSLIILFSLFTFGLATTSCRVQMIIDANPAKTKYCYPSKGCVYLTEIKQCTRDNEIPKCIVYDTATQRCLYCYEKSEVSWTKPQDIEHDNICNK
jgi:hypothetical protein